METRINKRKNLKRQKIITFFKAIIIFMTIIMLYYGIKLVNDYIVYLGYIEDTSFFEFDLQKKEFELFGENYFVDLKIFKKK